MGAILYVALAIPAAVHFGETLTDFLLIMSYWLGPWATVLALDCWFRRRVYQAESWNDPARLPERWPAILAMLAGLVGAALGAHQVLFQGPLAGWIGADVGFETAVVVTALVYLSLRASSKQS